MTDHQVELSQRLNEVLGDEPVLDALAALTASLAMVAAGSGVSREDVIDNVGEAYDIIAEADDETAEEGDDDVG